MMTAGEHAISMVRLVLATAALLAASGTAGSQPFGLDAEAPEPVLIEFKAEPGRGDFVGRAEGVVDAAGKRFYLKDINVMAPLVLQVLAKDPDRPIEVSLHRLFWEEVEWSGQTDPSGNWGYIGRVYQDVGIQITAAASAGFYVLAWQGPPVEPKFGLSTLAPATDSRSVPAADASGGGVPLTLVAVAIAVLALAAFFWLRRRRRSTAAALAVLGLLMMLAVATERAHAQVTVFESEGFDERLFAAELRLDDMHSSILVAMKDVESVSEATFRNFDMIVENWEEVMQLGIQHGEFAAETQRQLDALRSEMQRKDRQHERMIRRLETLIEEDRTAEPDPTVGGATLAASCTWDGSGGGSLKDCGVCYEKVNDKIASRLQYMEQARILYDWNVSMIRDSVAFGDAASGFHQLEQQKWYEVRRSLLQKGSETRDAYRQFMNNKAYPDLELWLRELAVCEAESGGIENWFERQGTLFLALMKTHYARFESF